jgi:hypothetical protein
VTTALVGDPPDEKEADVTSSERTPDGAPEAESEGVIAGAPIRLSLLEDREDKRWIVKMTGLGSQILAVEPTALYNFDSERGRKYMAEKVFHTLSGWAPFAGQKMK